MDIAFIISSILLLLFAVLALFDGFYLHIFKYRLHQHPESRFEHLTHTIRAVLFPLILYFLFLEQNSIVSFQIGIVLVGLDIVVLAVDAWSEKDSRVFMGGLPRWEYLLHLMVNGFHFASIAVFLALKLRWTSAGIGVVPDLSQWPNFGLFRVLVMNLLPGAVFIAFLHVVVMVPRSARVWDKWREKVQW